MSVIQPISTAGAEAVESTLRPVELGQIQADTLDFSGALKVRANQDYMATRLSLLTHAYIDGRALDEARIASVRQAEVIALQHAVTHMGYFGPKVQADAVVEALWIDGSGTVVAMQDGKVVERGFYGPTVILKHGYEVRLIKASEFGLYYRNLDGSQIAPSTIPSAPLRGSQADAALHQTRAEPAGPAKGPQG